MLRAAGGAGIPSYTWASKPATASNGQLAFVSDVGEGGTYFQYSTALTRWRAVNGTANLKTLGAAVSGIGTTEQIVFQTLMPANTWQTNDTIRIFVTGAKSGTVDTGNLTVRIGTAGTTADTAITGLSAYVWMGASGVAGGGIYDIKLMSATSAQRLGSTSTNAMTYYAAQSGGAAAATVISDASSSALYVSVSTASSGATNTVSIVSGSIQLVTV